MAVNTSDKPTSDYLITTCFATPDELQRIVASEYPYVLGTIGYNCRNYAAQGKNFLPEDVPYISLPLKQYNAKPLYEIWLSPTAVEYDHEDGIGFAKNSDLLFGKLEIASTAGPIEAITYTAFLTLLELLEKHDYPHLLRVWSYLPYIHQPEPDLEHYQLFCIGREEAFTKVNLFQNNQFPAATVVGTEGGSLTIYFIASRHAGITVENPRQTSAFHYPKKYGPVSPSFSRAMLTTGKFKRQLFISGTASIVGHESKHSNDPKEQVREIICNLQSLVRHAASDLNLTLEELLPSSTFKVYVKSPGLMEIIQQSLAETFTSADRTLYLLGDICREELLVEIEGLINF